MTPAPVALVEALDGAAVTAADSMRCAEWLRQSKKIRGWLDAFDSAVTSRLDELARQGESFGSEAEHVRCSGITSKEAGKLKERSKTLDQAEGFSDALAQGDVTASHVDQLAAATAHLGDDVRAGVFERVDELLDHAKHHDPGRFGRHVRDVARRLERDAGIKRDQQQRRDSYLTINLNAGTGMYDVRGSLHPELGSRVKRAIDLQVAALIKQGEAERVPEFVDRTVNRNRLAADALGDLVSGGHQMIRPLIADLTVIADAETLATGEYHDHSICETGDGAPLPVDSVLRLLCSAAVTPLIVGRDGNPLFAGRSNRVANRQQRRALRAMYRTCAAEGCDVEFGKCDMHHIVWWEHGGLSDLDNFVPLCSRHHHLVHELGWRLHLAPDRTLTVTDRNGEILMRATPDMPNPVRDRPPDRRTGPASAGTPPPNPTSRLAS
ncbi:MAG TPA: DUF222 domain-containing protein [Ilumatobacter sp.]|nr:DUF222 domain-containing protein [Ilumatobacter sp.]